MDARSILPALLAAAGLVLTGAEDCDGTSSPPPESTPTPYPDGELHTDVENADLLDLIPVTTVTMYPEDADPDQDEWAASFTITLADGDLTGADALNYLLSEFNLAAVTVTCTNGLPLLFNGYYTCPGDTATERQTRIVTLLGTSGSGIILDPDDIEIPYITFTMSEIVDEGARAPAPGVEPLGTERAEDSTAGRKDYIQPMGMHW